MNPILDFARGPLFAFCFVLMLFGLLRAALLSLFDLVRAVRNAGDKNVPYMQLVKDTVTGLIPGTRNALFGTTSLIFHIGVVIVPLFLLDHILLWRSGVGISWPAIPKVIADILTVITLVAGLALLGHRVFSRNARFTSTPIDYALLMLVVLLFLSGLVASRPYNPMPYEATMLIHVLCGNAIFVLIPFSKLSHCVLYPLLRISSNVAWRFPPRAGEEVNKTLYGEETRKV